jgi:hypothetical protein
MLRDSASLDTSMKDMAAQDSLSQDA